MAPPSELESRVLSKVTRRLIPFVFVCYVIAYIDRVNIGFVNKVLQTDLALSPEAFGFGAGLFFWGYFLFEIPSNLILERVGARVWIARIMIVWGFVSMAMIFVTGKWSFYGLRVLLGLAEAGFFPGIVLYLTYWLPARVRAKNNALFLTAGPVAMLIGDPLSHGLLQLHGVLGLKGWHWVFLVEGFPAVVLGLMALKFLTDKPEDARWLDPEERAWLSEEMARERAQRSAAQHGSTLQSLLNWKVWVLCAFYFLQATVTYGVFIWLPKILQDARGGKAGFGFTAIIFGIAIVAMVLIGRHSDRTGERKLHVAACALVACLGLVLASFSLTSAALLVAFFTICQIGQRSILAPFWTIPPLFLGGTAAAAGIALINAVGNLGGGAGTWVIGFGNKLTGGYQGGLLVLAAAAFVQSILVLLIRLPARKPAV